jgi:L-ribulose-5-phosphate 3-epimerase
MTIGIMQGRLSPSVNGKIQAFPADNWRLEFDRAKALKLDDIEWILESPLESNPLWADDGMARIRDAVNETGVKVNFICADYFMESPFIRMSSMNLEHNRSVLKKTVDQAALLGARGIEIPCVDASAIRSRAEEDELASALEPCLNYAASKRIEIGLETSLPPDRFQALLKRIGHPILKANYDTGNSASLGYNQKEEVDAYGLWINNVHIKDRILGGSTVPLGTGNADIPHFLKQLKLSGYSGGFVLQAARGADDIAIARRYREQLATWLTGAGFDL